NGEPTSVWDVKAQLGEGPVWFDGAVWFVDIKTHQVHRFDPQSGERRSWTAPEQVGFIFPARSGGFVAGLQSGLHRFDPVSGRFGLLVEVEPDKPGNRLNDGVVDPAGRLWFGTMDNDERAKSGAFYRFEGGELHRTGIEGIVITNGPAVSPDGRKLYWVDTLGGGIFACEIAEDGSLGTSREFARIAPDEGHPDGPTVDSEGHVWISLYAGWEARRYAPSGELVDRVRLPVANITKIAFGGSDLRTAYVTTARQLLSPEAIAKQPQIGDLFEFRVEVPGMPCPLVDV
ncbi:MAG: SMP-30/gluconolactonase/LRE family protein, partial [Pseudomonadota bacterium]|nr:SMP-30/gluconolactonase/LRE family protein [Pseudomonadota bacterium]